MAVFTILTSHTKAHLCVFLVIIVELHIYIIYDIPQFFLWCQVTSNDKEEEELEKLRRLQKYRLQNFRYFFGKAVYEEDDIEEKSDRLGVSTSNKLDHRRERT